MEKRTRSELISLILVALFTFSILLTGCGSGTKQEPKEKTPPTAETKPTDIERVRVRRYFLESDLIKGRKVFEDKNCSQCHSIFSEAKKVGPKLDTAEFRGSFLDIFSTLWNHAPAMSVHMRREGLPRPSFSIPELNYLVSFLYMLPYLSEPGDPVKGERLLMENQCFTCHSHTGKGKPGGVPLDSLAEYKSEVVLIQRMWNHGPVMISQMIATGTPVPSFTGKDMMNLFAALTKEKGAKEEKKIFLGVGDANKGRTLFAEKGCVACHAVYGEGGREAPDLGKTISQSSVADLTALLWNHSSEMQEQFRKKNISWPYFSETEMADLVVFLYSLNYIDKPGDPAKGQKALEEKSCADCHFETEEDMKKFINQVRPENAVQFATHLWNHLPTMEATMVSQAVTWPELSGQELRDILTYLQKQ